MAPRLLKICQTEFKPEIFTLDKLKFILLEAPFYKTNFPSVRFAHFFHLTVSSQTLADDVG
jgi:hypothetical protein